MEFKIGNNFTKNGIEYIIDSVEPSKILEIVSKENPIMVSYFIENNKKHESLCAINVRTQEEWDVVTKILKYKWDVFKFYDYVENSCININRNCVATLHHYLNNGYKVISYDEFLLNHSATISLEKFKSLFDGI